ncbi:MAG: DUF3592 domain-containing protein [Pseudomonadota bacterium]
MIRFFNIPYRLALYGALAFFVLPGLCVWILLVTAPTLERLKHEGVRAVAEVTYVSAPYDRVRATRGGGQRDVHYRYQARDGMVFEAQIREYAWLKRPSRVGDTFGVTYLPDAPHLHETDRGGRLADRGAVPVVLLIALVLGALALREWYNRPARWEGPRLWPPISLG